MNVQNLRTLLRKSNNKLSIFVNLEILNQYNCDGQEIFNLIKEFLTDEEKVRLFCCPHFQGYESEIIGCILDKNIKIKVLEIVLGKKCASKMDSLCFSNWLAIYTSNTDLHRLAKQHACLTRKIIAELFNPAITNFNNVLIL